MSDNITPTRSLYPVVLVPKGCLSDRAKHELRKAGYCVVQATKTDEVKQFYPDSFNAASARAKIMAFDEMLNGGPSVFNKDDVRQHYVNALKQQRAF